MQCEQVRRLKHTANQTQKIIKVLIEKVDNIQNIMTYWFEINKLPERSIKIPTQNPTYD